MRGLAIMSVLFDKNRNARFWTDAATAADIGTWHDEKGNSFCTLFIAKGSAMLGADRESPMCSVVRKDPQPWPGILDDLPADLKELLNRQPFGAEFPLGEVTFCVWNTGKGLDWKKAKIEYPKREPPGDPDGSKYLLGRFKQYFDHFDHEMDEEYEQSFDADTLFQVFSGDPVTAEDLRRLKSGLDLADLQNT